MVNCLRNASDLHPSTRSPPYPLGLRGRPRQHGGQRSSLEEVAGGGLVPDHLQEAADLAEAGLRTRTAMRDDHKTRLLPRFVRVTRRRFLDATNPCLLGVGAEAGAFPPRTSHLDNSNRGCSHQTSLVMLEPQRGATEIRDHQTNRRGQDRDRSGMAAVSTGLAMTHPLAETRGPQGLNLPVSEV